MQQFAMMCGLPGSGKDTFIKEDRYFDDFIIVSSDQVRKDKNYKPGDIKDVFDICRKDIVSSLSLGKNVIFNATNLNRKHRMNLLNYLHQKFDNIEYFCYVLITPIKVCKEWNNKREGFDKVPDEVIDHMVRRFQIPMKGEGFDGICFCLVGSENFCYDDGTLKYKYVSTPYDNVYEFDQDNPHHTLSLGDHMDKTFDYIWDNISKVFPNANPKEDKFIAILMAALYHDIGKIITKDYHDAKGNPSKTAHYYGHENVGAYLTISEFPLIWDEEDGRYTFERLVKIATYINFHMRVSFTWRNYPNGKCAKREKTFFNDFDLKCLELLGKADRQAH